VHRRDQGTRPVIRFHRAVSIRTLKLPIGSDGGSVVPRVVTTTRTDSIARSAPNTCFAPDASPSMSVSKLSSITSVSAVSRCAMSSPRSGKPRPSAKTLCYRLRPDRTRKHVVVLGKLVREDTEFTCSTLDHRRPFWREARPVMSLGLPLLLCRRMIEAIRIDVSPTDLA
jgi:hypothetical protein